MGKVEEIQKKAIEVIQANPDGVSYNALIRVISEALPDYEYNTIVGTIVKLPSKEPNKVSRPERGWYYPVYGTAVEEEGEEYEEEEKPAERDFYNSFADFFQAVEQCEKVFPLGGTIA